MPASRAQNGVDRNCPFIGPPEHFLPCPRPKLGSISRHVPFFAHQFRNSRLAERKMNGLLQETPLLISGLIEHVSLYHGEREIVSRMLDGSIHRCDARLIASSCHHAHSALLHCAFVASRANHNCSQSVLRQHELAHGERAVQAGGARADQGARHQTRRSRRYGELSCFNRQTASREREITDSNSNSFLVHFRHVCCFGALRAFPISRLLSSILH